MFYKVVGKSMEPAYKDGSVLWVSKSAVKFGLRSGDAVVALDPRDRRLILKRVTKVSKEGIFLEGDNSTQSTDSRTFGLVPKGNIIGKAMVKFPQWKGWPDKAVPALALLGLIDASYLTFKHFEGGEVACGIIPGVDCDVVLGSMYSEIFGIPLSLLGALYYLTVLVLGIAYLKRRKNVLLQLLFGVTAIGFLTSLYLIYIQAFVLNAYCPFCMISALTSIILFVSLWVMTISRGKVIIDESKKNE